MISLLPILYDESLLLSGDVTGFVFSIYSGVLGQYATGIMLLTIFAIIYIRTNSIVYGVIMWILVGGALATWLPTGGLNVAQLFVAMGIGGLLYSLVSRGTNS